MEDINYKTNDTLSHLVAPLSRVSSARLRQMLAEVGNYFNDIFSKIFGVLPESSDSEIGYIQTGGFPTVRINGIECPYITRAGITKRALERSGLYYKDSWKYRFWHSPETQFDFIRKANNAVGGALVEPIAIVLNDERLPMGYIMRRVNGNTLSDLIRSESLSTQDTLMVEECIAIKIERLHLKGIGHGDLNERNILLGSDLEVNLIDPLESVAPEKAMELDRSWLEYLHSELDRYRKNTQY